jgi:hypothetical protein
MLFAAVLLILGSVALSVRSHAIIEYVLWHGTQAHTYATYTIARDMLYNAYLAVTMLTLGLGSAFLWAVIYA